MPTFRQKILQTPPPIEEDEDRQVVWTGRVGTSGAAGVTVDSDGSDSGSGAAGLWFQGAGVTVAPPAGAMLPVTIPGMGAVLESVGSSAASNYSLTTAFSTVQPPETTPIAAYLTPGQYLFIATMAVTGCNSGDSVGFQVYDSGRGAVLPNSQAYDCAPSSGEFQVTRSFRVQVFANTLFFLQALNATGARGSVVCPRTSVVPVQVAQASTTVGQVSIGSFSPGYGLSGTTTTITGWGFTYANGVYFNGVRATGWTINSDTQITAIAPVTMTGPITVTSQSGAATSTGSYSYESSVNKAIQSISTANASLLLYMVEGTGATTLDDSSYGRTFNLSAGASWTSDASGFPTISLSSGNSSAQVTGPDSNMPSGDPSAMTVAVKFKVITAGLGGSGNNQNLITWGSSPSSPPEKFLVTVTGGGTIVAGAYAGGYLSAAPSTSPANGYWHVIVLTIAGTSANLYQDGSSVASGVLGTTPAAVLGGTTYLGYNSPVGGNPNYGIVFDYVGVWSRVLSGTEISSLT